MSKEENLQELAEIGKQQANRKSWKTFELEYRVTQWFNFSRFVAVFGIVAIFPIGLIVVPFFADDQEAFIDKYFGIYLACIFIPTFLLAILSMVVGRNRKRMTEAEKDSDDAKEKKYQRARDIANAGWSMSAIANFFRVNLGVKLVYFTFWLTFLGYAWPYFRFFHTAKTVEQYDWRMGIHTKFNPDEHGGYMAFYLFSLYSLPVILFVMATPFAWWQGRHRLKKEKKWLSSLPFPVTGYPEILSCRSDQFMFTIWWKDRKHTPDSEFLQNITLGLNKRTSLEREREGNNMTDSILIDFESSWTAQKKSNFKFYKFFHKFTEVVLLKLHDEYSIVTVEVGYN